MKRIDILLTAALATLFVACSKPSLEEKAKNRIKPATELLVNDPNSLIIQDIQPIIVNDSLCAYSFLAKAKNVLGGYVTINMEYFIRRNRDEHGNFKNEYSECVYEISNPEKKLLNKARKFNDGLDRGGVNLYKSAEGAAYLVSTTYSFTEKSYRTFSE